GRGGLTFVVAEHEPGGGRADDEHDHTEDHDHVGALWHECLPRYLSNSRSGWDPLPPVPALSSSIFGPAPKNVHGPIERFGDSPFGLWDRTGRGANLRR